LNTDPGGHSLIADNIGYFYHQCLRVKYLLLRYWQHVKYTSWIVLKCKVTTHLELRQKNYFTRVISRLSNHYEIKVSDSDGVVGAGTLFE
jgi:hypothetical protein